MHTRARFSPPFELAGTCPQVESPGTFEVNQSLWFGGTATSVPGELLPTLDQVNCLVGYRES
jgi:hypothetical protein